MRDMSREFGQSSVSVVFFDFDGVILESSGVKTCAFAELFQELSSGSIETILEHHRNNMGISRNHKFEWIYENVLKAPLSRQKRAELGCRFSAIVLQQILDAPMVPGAEVTLKALYENVPLYVVSGTPQEELDYIVNRRGLRRFFRGVYGSPRTKPEVIRELLGIHSIPPAAALLIGDAPSDYRAATETGVRFLARNSEEHHAFWDEVRADRIQDLTDVCARVSLPVKGL
jgi:phosphoglycolate phosphatase-like HAD superfamily hydrolase